MSNTLLRLCLRGPGLSLRVAALCLSVTVASGGLRAQCSLSCSTAINLSLDGPTRGCEAEVYPAQLGLDGMACGGLIDVDLYTANGTLLPGRVTGAGSRIGVAYAMYIGSTLTARATSRADGNFCETAVFVVDGQAPQLIAPDTVVSLLADIQPVGFGGTFDAVDALDCSSASLAFTDSTAAGGCVAPYYGEVYRTWTATDAGGNTASRRQRIFRVAISLDSIAAPPDTTLACTVASVDGVAYGLPAVGFGASRYTLPTLNGNIAHLFWTHSDEVFGGSGASGTQVLRTWRIYDECSPAVSGSNPRSYVQRIRIADITPPTVALAFDTLSYAVSTSGCEATVLLPAAQVADDCSTSPRVSVRLDGRQLNANGGFFGALALGIHEAAYTATDDAGNQSVVRLPVVVRDLSAPALITAPSVQVSLDGNGEALVRPDIFDEGTYDDCGVFELLIRRVGQSSFGEEVGLGCADLSQPAALEIAAVDQFGNANYRVVSATVRDYLPPQLIVPGSVTTTCDVDLSDLSVFGTPFVTDNCGYALRDSVEVDLNACGVGEVRRYWWAVDSSGNASQGTQLIAIRYASSFSESDIAWPGDATIDACDWRGLPDDLPSGSDRPTYSNVACERLAQGFTDTEVSGAFGACRVVLREWTVIDECVYDGVAAGVWRHTQTIRIVDDEAPRWLSATPDTVELTSRGFDCGAVVLDALAFAAEDCAGGVSYAITLDLFADGVVDSLMTALPTDLALPVGVHTATTTVRDACGNTSTRTIAVRVDCQPTETRVVGRLLAPDGSALPSRLDVVSDLGDTVATYYTAQDGSYDFEVAIADSATVYPSSEYKQDFGVTAFDLYWIGQHLLGNRRLLTVREQLSADANGSLSITAFDLTTTRRLLLGFDGGYLPRRRSYAFVPTRLIDTVVANAHRLPKGIRVSATTPVDSLAFTAVKVGDVSGAINYARAPGPLGSRSTTPFELSLKPDSAHHSVAVSPTASSRLRAASLSLASTSVRLSPKLAPYAMSRVHAGVTHISMYAEHGLPIAAGETLLTLTAPTATADVVRDAPQLEGLWVGSVDGGPVDEHEVVAVSVAPVTRGRAVTVAPNPVARSGALDVGARGASMTYLDLVDALGRRERIYSSRNGTLTASIPIEGRRKGYYVLVIGYSDGASTTHRIHIE